MGKGFDEFSIFGVGEAAVGRGVDERGLVRVPLAALEDDVVEKEAGWVGEKRCALHRSRLYMRSTVNRSGDRAIM